ncbi:probable protein phosphatase 2C 26 isoform X3 [Nymphaea colorata]|uniref:probable protein phosphatase 2C 26 isoform X3 n=1 Tax=Nymphaea colorata TaxID=210225 RepID=UPI00129D8ECD|nr:probable protein phosphatase 2C 26 isoform X3 [Nymphaea colorata]
MAARSAISLFHPHLPQLSSKPRASHLALSSSSSISQTNKSEVSFCAGTHLIPHPRKVEKGGEDAFFVGSYNGGVLAIADGVSGIVAMLEKSGILRIANVGDCGLRIIRKGKVIFSTTPQEHYFDCPFQLSSEIVGQTYEDAVVSNVEVMEGDTIVMGSDGLFDNVFDHEIVSVTSTHKDASEAATALASLANKHSIDVEFDSPYAKEARDQGFDVSIWQKLLGRKLTGGKLDDITVIVGQVVSSFE